jgi:hypothetical protein
MDYYNGDQMVQRWVWVAKDEEAMIGAHDRGTAWTSGMTGYVCEGYQPRHAMLRIGRMEGLVLVQV